SRQPSAIHAARARYAGSDGPKSRPPPCDTRPLPLSNTRLSSGARRFTRRPPCSFVSVAKSWSASAPRSDSRKPFLPCGDPWHAPELHPARDSAAITSRRNSTGSAALAGPTASAAKTIARTRCMNPPRLLLLRRINLPHLDLDRRPADLLL